MLPSLIACNQIGQAIIIPHQNSAEASLLRDLPVRLASSLAEVCNSLNGGEALPCPEPACANIPALQDTDLVDVYGQHRARRALEIAAAGGHHMLVMGPPGTGKSMLAQRLVSILPPMSEEEAMSSASIRSICRQENGPACSARAASGKRPCCG